MRYIVLSEFADLQDGKHVYGIGDEYPREGYSPTAERITELSSGKNLLQKPLIKLVEESVVVETPEAVVETSEEDEPETVSEEPKRKRVRKTNA